MMNEMLNRIWAGDHDRASRSLDDRIARIKARWRAEEGDPLPLVARAMAFVLAVSVASLTLTTTGFLIN